MKITILAYGSRGDVQPFVALARGLQKNGHEVKFAAPHRFAGFVGEYGIHFVPLAGDPEEISRRINDAGTNAARVVAAMWDYVFEIAPQVSRSAFGACEGAELIIHSFLFTVGGHSFAREHNIPDVSIQTFPMFAPTREFPNVSMAGFPTGWPSYLSHWLATQIFWHGGNMGYGPARRANPDVRYPKKLYYPFSAHAQTPLLFAYSPRVLPRPREWGEHIRVTGYFFLDDDESTSSVLIDFLSAGEAPICVSFGSMIHREAERIIRATMEAVRKTSQRAIFLTGWNEYTPERASDDMLFIEAASHQWLFPRCRMVIHHGGAGTTGAGLRAGIPNIVVPHTADQPFWGMRVHALGAGPRPIPLKRFNAERLADAMAEAEEDVVRKRAQVIGQAIREEDGIKEAMNVIESI